MKLNKKGQIEDLQKLVTPLVIIAIVLSVGFLIMAEGKSQIIESQGLAANGTSATHPSGTLAMNGTNTTVSAMADVPGWLPIFIIVAIGAILIGLVSKFKARN